MPVFNGEKYLAEAIDSILAQTFTDFELIIVDDGSQDQSAAIARDRQAREGRIHVVQLPENRGRADARNAGIALARGPLIAMMDGDDVSLPQRLQKQVEFMESNPETGCLGTQSALVNEDLQVIHDIYKPRQHALIVFQHFLGNAFLNASLMLRREYLHAVGGFEPGRRLVDDQHLIARLIRKTHIRFANLPDRLYYYRRHEQPKFINPEASDRLLRIEWEIKRRNLEWLWGVQASEMTVDRFARLELQLKLSWREIRAARRDLLRLIESLIVHNRVDATDRGLLIAEMNRLLEQASPRWRRMLLRWRRHRLGY